MIAMNEPYNAEDGERIAFMTDDEVRERFERIFVKWEHKQNLITKQEIWVREQGVKLLARPTETSNRGRRVVRKSEPMAG